MELEVKGKEFYVLRVKQGNVKVTLHNEVDSPIKKIKEYLQKGTSPDDIELMTVDIEEDKFEIKGIPWSTIALGFVKSE